MYQYPFLLLTEDDTRNTTIADMLEDNMLTSHVLKKNLYERLPDDFPVKRLHDLLELESIITKMLYDIFRSHMNIFNHDLPEIDQWRVKEKLKRTLTVMRRKSSDVLHNYDGYEFSDSLRKIELWEDFVYKKNTKPREWNSLFLNRVSDIHRHVHMLIFVMEPLLLLHNVSLTSTDDNHDHTSLINSLGTTIEATRSIYKEIKDYIRLIDSL